MSECINCADPVRSNRLFCSPECRSLATKYAWKFRLDRKNKRLREWADMKAAQQEAVEQEQRAL